MFAAQKADEEICSTLFNFIAFVRYCIHVGDGGGSGEKKKCCIQRDDNSCLQTHMRN